MPPRTANEPCSVTGVLAREARVRRAGPRDRAARSRCPNRRSSAALQDPRMQGSLSAASAASRRHHQLRLPGRRQYGGHAPRRPRPGSADSCRGTDRPATTGTAGPGRSVSASVAPCRAVTKKRASAATWSHVPVGSARRAQSVRTLGQRPRPAAARALACGVRPAAERRGVAQSPDAPQRLRTGARSASAGTLICTET
jgi:hypothetical protein